MLARDQNAEELLVLLQELMSKYTAARSEPFKDHALHGTMQAIAAWFKQATRTRTTLKVKASTGMGNWAVVPSLAFLDSRETTSTRDGVYVIVLFRGDMSGFYVTLNQGITRPIEWIGRSEARARLSQRAAAIRERFHELRKHGFETAAPIDVRAPGKLQELAESTIAHRFFDRTDSDHGTELLGCIEVLLDIYARYLDSPIRIDADRATWMRSRTGRPGN